MTLPLTGVIKLSDIQTEFGGPSPPRLKNYYLNGSNVHQNPNGTIPASGQIKLRDFLGGVGGLLAATYAVTANTTSVNEGGSVVFTFTVTNHSEVYGLNASISSTTGNFSWQDDLDLPTNPNLSGWNFSQYFPLTNEVGAGGPWAGTRSCSITVPIKNDFTTEGISKFRVGIAMNGTVLAYSPEITINDTSVTAIEPTWLSLVHFDQNIVDSVTGTNLSSGYVNYNTTAGYPSWAKFGQSYYASGGITTRPINIPPQWTLEFWFCGPIVSYEPGHMVGIVTDAAVNPRIWGLLGDMVTARIVADTSAIVAAYDAPSSWEVTGVDHLALSYDGTTYRAFANGILRGMTVAPNVSGQSPMVHINASNSDSYAFIDEFAFYSEARTENFTPWTRPYLLTDNPLGPQT